MKEKRLLIPINWVYGSKFGNEAHFLSFAAIIATRNGIEGSNFHVWNAMTTRIEMSGDRLVSIVGRNCTTMLTEPCPYLIGTYPMLNTITSLSESWTAGVDSQLRSFGSEKLGNTLLSPGGSSSLLVASILEFFYYLRWSGRLGQ